MLPTRRVGRLYRPTKNPPTQSQTLPTRRMGHASPTHQRTTLSFPKPYQVITRILVRIASWQFLLSESGYSGWKDDLGFIIHGWLLSILPSSDLYTEIKGYKDCHPNCCVLMNDRLFLLTYLLVMTYILPLPDFLFIRYSIIKIVLSAEGIYNLLIHLGFDNTRHYSIEHEKRL